MRRYGPGMHERMRGLFERDGLVYNPPPDIVPNSRAALRLTEHARDRGLHELFHDRLMDALWTEGRNIGDRGVLREVAAEVGLEAEEVDEVLAGEGYLDRVLASTREAQSIGVSGIPGFLLDRRLLVLGAHPREVFEGAFGQLQRPAP